MSLLHKIRVTKFSKGISGDIISNKFPTNSPSAFCTKIMQKQYSLHIISMRNTSRAFLGLSNICIYIYIYIYMYIYIYIYIYTDKSNSEYNNLIQYISYQSSPNTKKARKLELHLTTIL